MSRKKALAVLRGVLVLDRTQAQLVVPNQMKLDEDGNGVDVADIEIPHFYEHHLSVP